MAGDSQNTSVLEEECRYLYSCFFKREAPAGLVHEYVRAHRELPALRDYPEEDGRTLRRIVEKRLHAVAIEPWLRRKGSRHALTRKLLLLAFLAEAGGGHSEFSRRASGPLLGWLALAGNGVMGVVDLALGYAEKTFYGLV